MIPGNLNFDLGKDQAFDPEVLKSVIGPLTDKIATSLLSSVVATTLPLLLISVAGWYFVKRKLNEEQHQELSV